MRDKLSSKMHNLASFRSFIDWGLACNGIK